MVFSSAVFLFLFLPIVLIGHTIIKNTVARNGLLIIASLIFYGWGEPLYILLLLFSIVLNFLMGRLVTSKGAVRKVSLIVGIVINISMLVVFKYAGFLVELLNELPFVALPTVSVRMPIGISFFTFQALSYVIDCYRNPEDEKSSFFDVMLYICLFPQLVAGPIVKYNSVKEQLRKRNVTLDGITEGISFFIIGLSKKMLIANTMAVAVDQMFALSGTELDTLAAWVGAVSYTLQIYFDFSGYSDMAVGMGKIFGFTFPENFNYPYIAVSVRNFWKRWHISLTSWFREYLYFPLGGNRKGKRRTMWNRFFVFLCTGIWHGANLTFLFWGIYHGVLTIVETAVEEKIDLVKIRNQKIWRFFGHVYTLLAVLIGFVIFRAENLKQAGIFIREMFCFSRNGEGTMMAVSLMTPLFIITFIGAIIASTPIIRLTEKIPFRKYGGMLITILLYILCIFEIAAGSYNPFIYFRF